MTDYKENGSNSSEVTDLSLARQIKNLDREMRPERDLWLGIERQIQDFPQKRKLTLPSDWMPYGIAASLLIAFSALMLNIAQLDKPESGFVSTDQSFDRMQSEYVQVRNPMVQKFWEVNKDLDEKVLNDLYRNLDILEQARRDIEAQVRENPENRRLVEMLMSIHEQELDLLKRDYSQSCRSM
jgi:hypothetical protein